MTRRSLSLAVALGGLGGAVLILSAMFLTPGKYILIPYSAVVLGTLFAIRAERVPSFAQRFNTGLLAFVISSFVLYVSLAISPATSRLGASGHALRFALIVGVGAVINLATARVAGTHEHHEATAYVS
jgi:hypothetical protein